MEIYNLSSLKEVQNIKNAFFMQKYAFSVISDKAMMTNASLIKSCQTALRVSLLLYFKIQSRLGVFCNVKLLRKKQNN